nr:Ribosomal RNA methyltransferase (FmrO) [uncultured bacterium]
MPNEEMVSELVTSITNSKKYRSVYPKTIERIVQQAVAKQPNEKQAQHYARNVLHQVWGAYWGTRPNFKKVWQKFEENIQDGMSVQEAVLKILVLQSSTRERAPIVTEFYNQIFAITGQPETILDHACGLNPLSFFWMDLPNTTQYQAYDIDIEQIELLNKIAQTTGISNQLTATVADIVTDSYGYADVVFLLKTLPCLEQQEKGISLDILRKQQCKYIVVSYPIKSIGGKEKGMAAFYTQQFQELTKHEKWQTEKLNFETELVFVVQK